MVAGHLRVVNVIPAHREYLISSTPSEPIVAEAAAQVLRRQNMIKLLAQNVRDGLIGKGQKGELVARLLLTLAHDQALENMETLHGANQGQLENLYTSPIPVITFTLFTQQYADSLLGRHPDNDPNGPTFKDAFADAYVMFTHFGKAPDDWCMSHEFMFMALCRNMAISCRERMPFVDLCIPIHFGRKTPLSRESTSSILVSIKDKVDAMGANRTFVDIDNMAFKQDDTGRPFIILILQLGIQPKGEWRGRGGASIPQTPTGFSPPREGNTTDERPRVQMNNGLACYTIDVRGCSAKVFRVVRSEDEPLFSDLLASRHFLSEHSRQDTLHLRAVLAQKPVWTRGSECCSWGGLTTPPPDAPAAEAVANDIIFFGSEDVVE